MTAIVQAPVDALRNQFDKLTTALAGPTLPSSEVQYNKVKLDEDAKREKIFETSYEPSQEWWARDQAAYKAPGDDPLPEGFPEKSISESVWDGKVLINEPEKWLYRFTADDIAQIESAYTHFKSLDLPFNAIDNTTFPIPADSGLFKALKDAEHKVKYGLGLTVLRGLPVKEWDRTKQIAIFAGVSSYIGEKRIKQGKQNIVHLRDITNLDVDKRPAITVKGQTSGNQVFHNDGTIGIIGLITLGVAETGGLSQLSSVGRTYNELASTRRDIIRELAKNDWKNKLFPDGKALIFPIGQQVVSSYSRRPFFGFYEAESDFPPLPTEKHLALDAIHFTAERFSLDLELQVGDLEYANNLTVFHARTSSEDSETNQRHLVRVHLEHKDQPLPADVREVFDQINAGEADEWPQEAWDSVDRSGDPKSHLK